jgi:carbon-monoxide dehydrogenase medium subunit
MKPAAFDYYAPATLEEALSLLEKYGDEAKILAGGQSLMPLINMRLARPAVLVDINRISGLDFIREEDGSMAIGALARHANVASSEVLKKGCPMLPHAAQFVGDVQVRSRGTFGGCIAHADPAAEFGAVVYTLGGEIVAREVKGSRLIPVTEFFLDVLTTSLRPYEMVTEVRVPSLQGKLWSFRGIAPRFGDMVLAGVALALELDGAGDCQWSRIGMFGVGSTPLRASKAEEKLLGNRLEEKLIAEIAGQAAAEAQPASDIHASASYRRELVRWLVAWNLRNVRQKQQEKKQ